jgi:hypothetical protein
MTDRDATLRAAKERAWREVAAIDQARSFGDKLRALVSSCGGEAACVESCGNHRRLGQARGMTP